MTAKTIATKIDLSSPRIYAVTHNGRYAGIVLQIRGGKWTHEKAPYNPGDRLFSTMRQAVASLLAASKAAAPTTMAEKAIRPAVIDLLPASKVAAPTMNEAVASLLAASKVAAPTTMAEKTPAVINSGFTFPCYDCINHQCREDNTCYNFPYWE